jgi:hypothetical protein
MFSSSRTLPGQVVRPQADHRGLRDRPAATGKASAQAREKILDQQRDIRAALAQRRDRNWHHLLAIEQILAEGSLLDAGDEIGIARRDHARVNLARAVGAHRAHDPVLEHAQELGLKLQRHLANLVEEDRSAVSRAEEPVARPRRAGEGAALVAEHLGLEQLMRNLRAVDGDESAAAPPRQAMNRPRDDFLAGAALAGDQHRRVACGHAIDQCAKFDYRGVFADEAVFDGRSFTGVSLGFRRDYRLAVPQ